jgi:hypothetical protein
MGFRNPVTSISGDQITPGTITGSVFRTAAAGNRVVISAAFGQASVALNTGDVAETQGAYLTSGVDTAGAVKTPWLRLASPLLTDMLGTEASIKLNGPPLNGTGPGSADANVLVRDSSYLPPAQARGTASAYTAALTNGGVILGLTIPAVPIPTRFTWQAQGNGGYPDSAASMNFLVSPSPAMVLIAGVSGYNVGTQPMLCTIHTFIPLSQGGAFLVPANTAVTLNFACSTDVAVYYRLNVNWTRSYEP